MHLFRKKKSPSAPSPFPLSRYEPVLRSSICTGETTACMRNRETGKLTEIMMIRGEKDLTEFGEQYGVDVRTIRTVY